MNRLRIARVVCLLMCTVSLFAGCTKELAESTTQSMDTVSRSFKGTANQTYYAIRWALAARGYPVGYEDLPGGVISSSWIATKAGSHYVAPFGNGHRDYGQTGAYHQLELRVLPSGGTTTVDVTSRTKSIIANLHSSGSEERAVLDEVGNYLRANTDVTNLGVEKE